MLGLASAHGLTVKDGRLTRIQIRSIADSFAGAPAGASRILVTHHPLVSLPGDEPGEIEPALRGARRALKAVRRPTCISCSPAIIICTASGSARRTGPRSRSTLHVMIVQAGTATSFGAGAARPTAST